MSYVQLSEAQLYDLGNSGSRYDDRFLKLAFIRHLHDDHNMSIRDIAKRMNMKMKLVQTYLNATVDKSGRIEMKVCYN